MRNTQHPLVVCYGYSVGEDEFHFLARHGVVQIKHFQDVLGRILPLCNGYSTLEEICAALPDTDSKTIKKLINVCERQDVIIDSRQLYRRFHADTNNPGNFMHSLSAVQVARLTQTSLPHEDLSQGLVYSLPLLQETIGRASVRQFSGKSLEERYLRALLASMYRIGETRSVPSGGALYPLTLYLLLYIGTENYPSGIYKHNHYSLELEWVKPLPEQDAIERAFDTRELLKGAVGTIVITGNLERSTGKYANRGYRYTILEAGHVAQNAYLYVAQDERLGLVEYGGFLDQEVAKLLGIKYPKFAPIVTMMFGIKDSDERELVEVEQAEQLRQLEAALVGKDKPVVGYELFTLQHQDIQMNQWAASAVYRHPHYMRDDSKNEMSFATGVLMNEAGAKVLGEAYERYICFSPRADMLASANEVGSFLHPVDFFPYADEHPVFRRYKLTPFNLDQNRAWVKGTNHLGHRIYVPADVVYYAKYPMQQRLCYIPSSTGVAAHPDFEQAKINAMLELIERDAIAVHWYGKLTPPHVAEVVLPSSALAFKRKWENAGWKVYILDITVDLTPVCMVLLVNRDSFPVLSSGAASSFTMDKAIQKACLEAEYMALSWQKRRKKKMTVERVRLPDDHGMLYATGNHFHEIEHLLCGRETEKKHLLMEPSDIYQRTEMLTVRMDEGKYPLFVVRVMSKHLLPLTFGFETEHYGHPRLSVLKYAWNRPFPSIPHIFS